MHSVKCQVDQAPTRTAQLLALLVSLATAQVSGAVLNEGVSTPQPADCATTSADGARRFEVGPGQRYAELQLVPWLSLRAGDVVNIHYRAEPYRARLLIRGQGSAQAPIIINGVTDTDCHRPVIDGDGATPTKDVVMTGAYNQWTEPLATVLIAGSWSQRPRFIEIRNLVITGAHKDASYRKQDGSEGRYLEGSAGIHAVAVEDLTVDRCDITGNGNGIFVNTKNDNEQEASYRVTIRRSRIYDNGSPGSWFEHNLYVQAVRPIYEGNYIGQLIPGALGSSLKDRSSGPIIRYNTIIAAARALDLVETEGGATTVFRDPTYHNAWVYGNVIVSDHTLAAAASASLIHWGGDNTPRYFRRGTLYFYHNTVFVRADRSSDLWRVHLFDMPDQQTVELRANVLWHVGSTEFDLGQEHGTIRFAGVNWLSSGWQAGGESSGAVHVETPGRLIEGADPGLDRSFTPTAASPLLDQGEAAPADLESLWIERQIAGIASTRERRVRSTPDLGAIDHVN